MTDEDKIVDEVYPAKLREEFNVKSITDEKGSADFVIFQTFGPKLIDCDYQISMATAGVSSVKTGLRLAANFTRAGDGYTRASIMKDGEIVLDAFIARDGDGDLYFYRHNPEF